MVQRGASSYLSTPSRLEALPAVDFDHVISGAMHDDEMWLVKLDDGHVRTMTLEELDAAYQRDEIHERTMICRDGGDRWITLAEELGLEPPPPPRSTSPSVLPVVADVGDDHDHDHDHVGFSSSRKGTRIFAIMIGVLVLGAFGVFAATTAVNANRTRARAALASQLAAAAALEARTRAAEPEPEATTQPRDANKPQQLQRRNKTRNQGNAAPQQAPDKPAGTVFTTGGDDHDPLNAKL